MATLLLKGSYSIILALIFVVYGSNVWLVNCTEFEVGGHDGWVVPNSRNNDQMYNQWASQNRFKVGDTLRFKYEKDSVMVVSEQEYESCRSSRPLFFSNNGETVFKFDRPGMFYFISGVSGHCARGQKMIIKVLDVHVPPAPAPQSQNVNATQPKSESGAAHEMRPTSITTTTTTSALLFVMSFFGLLYA